MNKLLLIVLLLLAGCKDQNVKTATSFNLYYENAPTAMLRGATEFIKITSVNNKCSYEKGKIYKFISKEDGQIKEKKTKLIQKEITCSKLTPVFKLIKEENFFEFKDVYKSQVLDGNVEKLKISIGKKHKQVLVFNQVNDDFEKIVKKIKELK